ncbi:hypothetical protein GLW08_00965 [Pontibacillus yanchengensis]|uniref:Uncharacterized protein n=1 Tax=Pontibacillus yanchengensis TaxID=462910 RepID=A0ACC7VCM2_9BACI|nr:hypothetical protein [Pontibacillus yanchengensis]MYL51899.1 hypothetical protein [Pontibacillus yanchengensis]
MDDVHSKGEDETIHYVYSSFLRKCPMLLRHDQEKLDHIRKDTLYHIEHLEAASEFKMDSIFLDYVRRTDSKLTSRGIKTELLNDCFTWMKEVLRSNQQ